MTARKKRSPAATVELTQRALADLREIQQYTVTKWGRKAANKYMGDIAAALDRLSEKPEILRLEPDFSPNLFFYRVKKHFLVCDLQADIVLVLAVIHTSMDLPARLLELEPRLIAEAQSLQGRLRKSSGPN